MRGKAWRILRAEVTDLQLTQFDAEGRGRGAEPGLGTESRVNREEEGVMQCARKG